MEILLAPSSKYVKNILLGVFILFGLYLTSLYSYPLFHSLAEIFSIVIAFCIFIIAWNSRRLLGNNYLLFIGIAYLFVGTIDLIHTLAYKGMNIFRGYETNLPTQLWIGARYVESLSLLIAPLFFRKRLKINIVFLGYTVAISILLLSIFYWDIFPVCFIDGVGLTPFKKISEYIISLILLASIALLLKNRKEFDPGVLKLVVWSIITTIASELAFTFYIHAYGLSNLIGHIFKILSFYFIYKALIETGLAKPYNLLFRDLKQSEEALRQAHDKLEVRVQERTAELAKVNQALKTLSECNQALVRATEEKDLLHDVCRILIEVGGYRLAWISFAVQDEEKNVFPVAQVGYGEGYLEAAKITWTDNESGRGPTGTAIQTGKTFIIKNILTDPNYASWRAKATERGYASAIVLPLIAKSRIFGALNICAIEPDAFDEEKIKLLMEMADDLAYGIMALRMRIEHRQAEKALRESEYRYRNLIDTARDVILTLSLDGTISSLNPAFEILTGWSRAEWVGKSFIPIVHPDDKPLALEMYRIALQGETTPLFELHILTKQGEYIVGEFIVAPQFEGGQVVSVLGVARDVTERKRAEEETKILQEQLRQSQKMEAIGRLAGGIAHDFNNLLTIIKGYGQLSLMELKEGDLLKGNIDEIQKATERAAALTRQLLAFSRRQVMEMKVLDLNTVLRDLDKMLRRVIGEDIELVTFLADDLGSVKIDPGQIEQVVLNLAVNARDAMPSGGKLTIETANIELDETYARSHVAVKPGRYAMLSVSDTGVGMTSEVKERVFEPFFTTKAKGKGTGLGLSTVYGIVKQSGGNIWVYSELGKGTTFKIYLPRVDEPLEEIRKEALKGELPRGSETVLVVEDEEEVRKLIVKILEKQGYRIIEASQGNDALLISEKHDGPIDLILVDVVMPGMSGSELAKRLKSLHSETKVLYMSGYTDNAIAHHGVLEKGVNYIQKPFTMDGLARKVREVLDKDSPT